MNQSPQRRKAVRVIKAAQQLGVPRRKSAKAAGDAVGKSAQLYSTLRGLVEKFDAGKARTALGLANDLCRMTPLARPYCENIARSLPQMIKDATSAGYPPRLSQVRDLAQQASVAAELIKRDANRSAETAPAKSVKAASADLIASELIDVNRMLSVHPTPKGNTINAAIQELDRIGTHAPTGFQSYTQRWIAELETALKIADDNKRANAIESALRMMGLVSRPLRQQGKWPAGVTPAKSAAKKATRGAGELLDAVDHDLQNTKYGVRNGDRLVQNDARYLVTQVATLRDRTLSALASQVQSAVQMYGAKDGKGGYYFDPRNAAKIEALIAKMEQRSQQLRTTSGKS